MLTARTLAWFVAAFLGGVLVAAAVAPRLRPPAPSPTSPPSAVVTVAPAPTDDPRVFRQPLVAGCSVSRDEVYAVSEGGGIARFDGATWFLIDDTLRTLHAVACHPDVVVAVGAAGRIVRIDTADRRIASDEIDSVDLFAVALSDRNAIYAAGKSQVVLRLVPGNWSRIGDGEEALAWRAALALRGEIWLAGDGPRLVSFDGRRFLETPVRDAASLRALAASRGLPWFGDAEGRVFGIGQGGAYLLARVLGPVRSLFDTDDLLYVVADALSAVRPDDGSVSAVETPLACTPLGVFGTAKDDVWVLASSGGRTGLAHFDGTRWTRWGRC